MTNYSALGEYTAYAAQARDAALRRCALLNNLAATLRRQAERPADPFDSDAHRSALDDIDAACRELSAALDRANQAAALCGERAITVDALVRLA